VWRDGGRFALTTTVADRDDAPVLSDGVLTA
jgi:hypothetical protein